MSQSSISSNQSRRRRLPPPPRLGWPAAVAPPAADHDDDGDPIVNHNNKRPRRVTFGRNHDSNNKSAQQSSKEQQQQQLWSDKYAPKSSSELAVAPKKVKEVGAWLKNDASGAKLLILVGGPGIGKSAMIRCLAREQRLTIQEWTESYSSSNNNNNGSALEHLTPLNSLQEFLQQTATGFASLAAPTSFNNDNKKSLILLDELPHLHGPEAAATFSNILTQHVQRTAVPTVLIYSDTVEGKAKPDALEQLVHPRVLYNPAHCRILQIHAPTKSRLAKVLQTIAATERRVVRTTAEELHERCHGDLRFAITTLQYEMAGGTNNKTTMAKNGVSSNLAPKHSNNKPQTTNQRDTKLTSFHALGKLLYAKRGPANTGTRKNGVHHNNSNNQLYEHRPSLEFDPERVVEQSEMELHGVLHFLGAHSPDFFTENGELSVAFGYFSDAAMLLDHRMKQPEASSSNTVDAAASLAGRAVAHAKRHPAAHRFRQFSAPRIFDVMRKRRDNQARLRTIATASQLSAATYCLDVLPFVRTIEPQQTTVLNSYFDAVSQRQAKTQEDEQAEMAALVKEQQEILQLDDIVEDDDDDDGF